MYIMLQKVIIVFCNNVICISEIENNSAVNKKYAH